MNKKPTAATSSSSSPATAINHRIIELQRKNAVYLHHSSRSALGMVFVRTNPCAPTNPVKIVENFPHLRGKFKIKLMKTMPLVGWLVGRMDEKRANIYNSLLITCDGAFLFKRNDTLPHNIVWWLRVSVTSTSFFVSLRFILLFSFRAFRTFPGHRKQKMIR